MGGVVKLLSWLGAALGVLIVVLAAAFGMLQTRIGKDWAAKEIARAVSDPDFTVEIDRLDGFVPFHMSVERIAIGDRDGTYLTLRNAGLDISPSALLTGRAHVRSLTIAELEMTRSSTAPSTTPFTDYLKVPHLPVAVALDRMTIGKIALAPPVLGEKVAATAEGGAELADDKTRVALDLHRTDDSAGNILLAMEIAGDPPVLSLKLDAAEPTGLVLDRLLARTDHLPLAFSLTGTGPLVD
jgi:translocation and assembly module TamB